MGHHLRSSSGRIVGWLQENDSLHHINSDRGILSQWYPHLKLATSSECFKLTSVKSNISQHMAMKHRAHAPAGNVALCKASTADGSCCKHACK